jgi:CRP/FNR family transcriptional regulator
MEKQMSFISDKSNPDFKNSQFSAMHNLPRISSNSKQLFSLCGIDAKYNLNGLDQKFLHVRVKTGCHLYLSNDKCEMIYLIYSGFFKNTWSDMNGVEKVIDFPMKNEMVGLDGIAKSKFVNSLQALTDSELIAIPLEFCRRQNLESETFRDHIITVMSQQLINEQKSSFIISTLSVDAKVAKFLLGLSYKFKSLGYSEKSFLLRMTREEIGSYLGVSLETVSRTISGLCSIGIIRKQSRLIEIMNLEALKKFKRLPIGMTGKANTCKQRPDPSSPDC